MPTKDELLQTLLKKRVELREILKNSKKDLSDINDEIALLACPFEIGDVVEVREGKRFRISRIRTGYPDFELSGYYIKKDGKDGAEVRIPPWYGEPKLVK